MSSVIESPLERCAGVCLHITSLPGNYGIGELGDNAARFIKTLASMELTVWQFLPTGPTAFGDSPYQPLSSFAGNEMLIDLDALINVGLLSAKDVQRLTQTPAHAIDYGTLIPQKTALLTLAASRFRTVASAKLRAEFDDFLGQNDERWLHDYALFRILKTRHGERPWAEWERPFVVRDPQALRKLEANEAAEIEATKVIQFLFHQQWRDLRDYAAQHNVSLFGDMPFCVALDSADAWSRPGMLLLGGDGTPEFVAGVPPDYFSEDGQLWGNPLYDWKHHEISGYSWWIDRIRHATSLVDLVRIDHFRGFESFWSIPATASTARIGTWEPGPGSAIFDAMQSALGNLPIVAEDLGAITQQVEALRNRYNIPGMKVLQFETSKANFDIGDINQNAVCYTGTHDNDTTVGWFRGGAHDNRSDKEIRRTQKSVLKITGGAAETIHTDMIELAFSSNANVAIAPMQDFLGLGSEARLNTPGTLRNNWRWRLLPEQITVSHCDRIREMVQASWRGIGQA